MEKKYWSVPLHSFSNITSEQLFNPLIDLASNKALKDLKNKKYKELR